MPLALKAAVFSGLLYLSIVHRSLSIVFVLAAFYFYLQPLLNATQFLASFLILLTVSFLSSLVIGHWSFVISLFFGLLFFLLLGIKNLIFVRREPLYLLLNGLLFLTIFILFFWSDISRLFFVKYLALFSGLVLLLREFLLFSVPNLANSQKRNLIICGTAFLILQLLWAISLLSVSFLNAASLALLVVLILQDFIGHHLSGTMSRQIVLRNITIFLILFLVIFAASKWTL